MQKIFIFFLTAPLFISLLFGTEHNTFEKRAFNAIDTISSITKNCLECHSSLLAKSNKHSTKTERGCADCHTSNGTEHPKAGVVGFTLLKTPPDLCLSCHTEKKDLLASSAYIHGPVKDKKSCTNCHSPHSSDVKKLLIANRKDLCLSCHSKTIKTADAKKLTNFSTLLKTSKVLHPPFEDCEKVCHNPHASQDPRLLNDPFPTNRYLAVASDSFALCWECHGSDMIEKPKSKGASNFRNDDVNLHYTHVHGDKGRSCMVCHSPHATVNLHLIREKVSFGKWEFDMNYKADENGGSCAPGCHKERKYTR